MQTRKVLTPKQQSNLIEALEQTIYCRIQEAEGWYKPNCRQSMPKKHYCDRCKLIERVAAAIR